MRLMISSASAKIPLLSAAKSALVKLDPNGSILAADRDSNVVSKFLADEFWQMPSTSDDNVEKIINGCLDRHIDFVLPSRDAELLFWARHKNAFHQKNIHILVAPIAGIELCLDKLAFARFGKEKALPIIATSENISDIYADYFVVKERYGAGSKAIGLGLDKSSAIKHAATLQSPIFQPLVRGKEVSIDAWLDKNAKLKGHIYRYREKVQHGESQISTTAILSQYDALIKPLLEGMQLTGPVVLQAMIDTDDKLWIIECNGRLGGASTLGIKAGLDSLYWSLAETLGRDISTIPFNPPGQPLTQIRYAQDMYL